MAVTVATYSPGGRALKELVRSTEISPAESAAGLTRSDDDVGAEPAAAASDHTFST
jgi:hypothetical protein